MRNLSNFENECQRSISITMASMGVGEGRQKGPNLPLRTQKIFVPIYVLPSIPEIRHYGYRRVHTRNVEVHRPYPKKKMRRYGRCRYAYRRASIPEVK